MKHPSDFTKALVGGVWNPDTIVRMYRGLNPSITRAQAIEAFKSLKIPKDNPLTTPELDYWPTDFSDCVVDGKWNYKTIASKYGIDLPRAKAHFRSLGLSVECPFVNSWSFPANLLNPRMFGTVYIKADPPPTIHNPLTKARIKTEPWVDYLVKKHGSTQTFLTLAYNTGVHYDIATAG